MKDCLPARSRGRLLPLLVAFTALVLSISITACGDDGDESSDNGPKLTVYSGREEDLVESLFDQYEDQSGVDLEVRYGDSAELAATITEEGSNTPADVYFGQDAGALGALQKEGLLQRLPRKTLAKVDKRFRSKAGEWVGTSGRARVFAYNKEKLTEADLPKSILDFTDPKWKGRIGWAPTNASFQTFVTALRLTKGDAAAERWLKGIVANEPKVYEKNGLVRDAIADGEIDVGFINHYYVIEAQAEEGPDYPVEIYFPPGGDVGSLVNVAGAAVLKGADQTALARDFVDFLLSRQSQQYFAKETKEYPLTTGVKQDAALPPLAEIEQPDVDLNDLDDLKTTLSLIERSGALNN